MAILSNINDKFRVDSAGAVYFGTSAGTNGLILKSVGTGGSPVWVDPNTVGTGPWLPLAGGAITNNLTIGGTLGVTGAQTGTTATFSGNVQAPTFNGLAINTTGTNNVANQIVRTEANGYANFGWINSVSGATTGTITRITASEDAYLRYVTPATFRTQITDPYYAPTGTVSGVTSVSAGNGLAASTNPIISTGTLSTVHLPSFDTRSTNPDPEDNNNTIRFDFKSNSTNGLSDGGSYNGQMTWRSYGGGSDLSGGYPIRLAYTANGNLWRQMGTSATSWGAWNKFAICTGTSSQYIRGDGSIVNFPTITTGTVTSVATGTGLTGGTITTTGTLSVDSSVVRVGNLNTAGNTPFAASSTATSYSVASIELRESNYSGASGTPPFIGFHWGGVVASSIAIESSGRIAILNNPGTGYENFIAGTITAASSFQGNLTGNVTGTASGENLNTVTGRGNSSAGSIVVNGICSATTSVNSPIFYDSDNTGYYGNFSSNSNINSLTTAGYIQANSTINLKDRITLPASSLSSASGRPAYAIYQEGGAWTYPYPDLCLAMHTGIKLGANASYNGIRFYTDYDMSVQVMAVNDSSSPIGAGHVYVNQILQAGSSLRAPIFYDSTNTAYYGNFASTSNINALTLVGALSGQNGYFAQDLGIGFGSGAIGGKINIRLGQANQIGIKNDLGAQSNPTGLLSFTTNSMNAGGYHMIFQATPTSGSDTNMLLCDLNGNLRNRNNSYGQYSDRTIKENITDATPKLEDIKKLKVKNFNFIGDDLKQIGLIAQETELVFPGLVEDDLNPQGNMVKSLKYSVLVPILVKAIQELEARVKELENKQ